MGKTAYPIDERTPAFRRIHFSNITARNVHASAGFIYGLAEQFIQEITFDNIDVSMAQDAVQCPCYDDRDRGNEQARILHWFCG